MRDAMTLARFKAGLLTVLLALAAFTGLVDSSKAATRDDYRLGPGDTVRIQVFRNPDLTVEARLSETGTLSYPLLGAIRLVGLSTLEAEKLLASRLREGDFVRDPQVTINVLAFRSQQVSVLGRVNRPGRYSLETTGMRLSEILSQAGGIAEGGADTVVLISTRGNEPVRIEIDLVRLFASADRERDPTLKAGDVVYVEPAARYFIYGQVNRPGMYTVERDMTLAQALAKGGGLTLRGTERGVRVHRRDRDEAIAVIELRLDEPIRPNDLIFVRESLF